MNVPLPSHASQAATRFAALVRECSNSRNPILTAAARDPKLYAQYRESFSTPGTTAARPAEAPSADAKHFQAELTRLSEKHGDRGIAIAKMAVSNLRLFNTGKNLGLI